MAAYTPIPDKEGVIITAGNWQIQIVAHNQVIRSLTV